MVLQSWLSSIATRSLLCQKAFKSCLNAILTSNRQGALRQLQGGDCETKILSLPTRFLRESDASNYDEQTFQRNNKLFDMSNGKPVTSTSSKHLLQAVEVVECEFADGRYRLLWSDGTVSEYSAEWVDQELDRRTSAQGKDVVLWRNLTESDLRSDPEMNMEFPDVLTDDGMLKALQALYRYGLLLVTQTPVEDAGEGVAALGAALGGGALKNQTSLLAHYNNRFQDRLLLDHGTDGPMRTLYGTVWSTVSSGQAEGASVADSAYGQEALPLHTDMTYLRDPPGLQIFTMVQPAATGGESVFADGFMAAERLQETNPLAFETLRKTHRRYQCIDKDTGWHLEATGPVLSTLGPQHRVVGIRHNDLDRLPDLPPRLPSQNESDVNALFYNRLDEAHAAWDDILGQDATRLVVKLQTGDTIVVSNQRCLHGRCAFVSTAASPRAVRGCYVSQSELESRFRVAGYNVTG